jgi:hypothetical protein
LDVEIPKNAILERIIEPYELSDLLPCCLSSCHTKHKKGYIIVFRSSEREPEQYGRIGHKCGAKAFHQRWEDAQQQLDIETRKQLLRISLERFVQQFPEAELHLEHLVSVLSVQYQVRRVLIQHAPDFISFCQRAFKAENGVVRGYDKNGNPIQRILKGADFYLDTDDTDLRALTLLEQVRELRTLADKPDTTERVFEGKLRRLANLRRAIWSLEDRSNVAAEALSMQNFAVAAAFQSKSPHWIRLEGTKIFLEGRRIERRFLIDLPSSALRLMQTTR